MTTSQFQNRPAEILLVEDEKADIDLIKRAFKKSKLANNISVVMDGEAALSFLNNEGDYANAPKPDLILMDLNLPKKSGREVIKEIKKSEKLCTIPVSVLTSSEAEEDIAKSYQLGANCYIRKPIDLEEIKKIVNTIEEFWFCLVTLPPAK